MLLLRQQRKTRQRRESFTLAISSRSKVPGFENSLENNPAGDKLLVSCPETIRTVCRAFQSDRKSAICFEQLREEIFLFLWEKERAKLADELSRTRYRQASLLALSHELSGEFYWLWIRTYIRLQFSWHVSSNSLMCSGFQLGFRPITTHKEDIFSPASKTNVAVVVVWRSFIILWYSYTGRSYSNRHKNNKSNFFSDWAHEHFAAPLTFANKERSF